MKLFHQTQLNTFKTMFVQSLINFPLSLKFVKNMLQKWFHIFWNISFFKSLLCKSDIELLLNVDHSVQSLNIHFLSCWFIACNHSFNVKFLVNSLNRSANHWQSSFLQHRQSYTSLSNIKKIKTSLDLVCIKDREKIPVINIVNVTAVQISMNYTKMMRVIYNCDVIRVQFNSSKDRAMNLIPVLYSFGYFGVLLWKFSANLVHLSKKPSPGIYYLFVFHPSKFHKV